LEITSQLGAIEPFRVMLAVLLCAEAAPAAASMATAAEVARSCFIMLISPEWKTWLIVTAPSLERLKV
jgi:hypothetical protein